MEGNKERVLAYGKAKLIEKDALSEVSGGSQLTGHATLRPSAADHRGVDIIPDVVLDN